MKRRIFWILVIPFLFLLNGCYSLSGAVIQGKTINIYPFENRASNVVPSLTTNLSDKIRRQILSQTGLTPVNTDHADYEIHATIVQYNVTISGMENQSTASQNRLTIGLEVEFVNTLNEKDNFKQTFSRFADFPASQQLQSVEGRLIEDIGDQMSEDIFNKAFVNW